MTPLVWSWLLSLTGAGSFFAAGVASTARRAARIGFNAGDRYEAIERELAQRTADRQQLLRELEIELRARLAQREHAVIDTHEMTSLAAASLLEELAIAREQLSRRDSQIEGLRRDTAQLRSLEAELTRATRELGRLNEQNHLLRVQAFVSKFSGRGKPHAGRPAITQAAQVIVRDDQDVTLTVRRLATDDPGLALVDACC